MKEGLAGGVGKSSAATLTTQVARLVLFVYAALSERKIVAFW